MGEKIWANVKLPLKCTETLVTWAFVSAVQRDMWLAHAPEQPSLP